MAAVAGPKSQAHPPSGLDRPLPEHHEHINPSAQAPGMEAQVSRLVEKTWDLYLNLPGSKRLLIGVAGIPGSGKTTLASTVTDELNERFRRSSPGRAGGQQNPLAAMVPMDGYHLTRAQLSAMPAPAEAHARRGAAFTFDGAAYRALIRRLRQPLTPECTTLYAPSFDHAVKDPVPDDIAISTAVRVVVFEGNYVALDEEPWRDARAELDEVWFVHVPEEVARARLVRRHVAAGIAKDEDEAGRRADENDLVNGREIQEKLLPVDELLESLEDDSWQA